MRFASQLRPATRSAKNSPRLTHSSPIRGLSNGKIQIRDRRVFSLCSRTLLLSFGAPVLSLNKWCIGNCICFLWRKFFRKLLFSPPKEKCHLIHSVRKGKNFGNIKSSTTTAGHCTTAAPRHLELKTQFLMWPRIVVVGAIVTSESGSVIIMKATKGANIWANMSCPKTVIVVHWKRNELLLLLLLPLFSQLRVNTSKSSDGGGGWLQNAENPIFWVVQNSPLHLHPRSTASSDCCVPMGPMFRDSFLGSWVLLLGFPVVGKAY